ncbi:hypothetical protein NQ318_018718 [Aromia moschata]|uniref:N-acetyltransferase domain-containing protein n=1 Tax=Aromia moschata TaxID=1265417 RepID=A0AAV8ZI34_9CUCU|nr:hypothetical protein NQ318_018718 [Aromia moschata]
MEMVHFLTRPHPFCLASATTQGEGKRGRGPAPPSAPGAETKNRPPTQKKIIMGATETDILVDIPEDDLPKLAEMYEPHKEWAPHAYSIIKTGIEWRQKGNNKLLFMSPNNCWKKDGTFFVLMQYYSIDIFVFTLDDSGENAYEAMLNTRRFNISYTDRLPLLYSVHRKLHPVLMKAIKDRQGIIEIATPCYMYSISKEKAMEFDIECPPDVYIKKLDPSHASTVNSVWPHRYSNSEKFVAFLLTMNDGYGVFLKSNDELVSWIIVTMLGQLGLLQTKEAHKKKGYAALVTRQLSKKIAEKGFNVFGTVLVNNVASIRLFEKLGFRSLEKSVYTIFSL